MTLPFAQYNLYHNENPEEDWSQRVEVHKKVKKN